MMSGEQAMRAVAALEDTLFQGIVCVSSSCPPYLRMPKV